MVQAIKRDEVFIEPEGIHIETHQPERRSRKPPLLLIHGNRDHAHNWDWTAARLQERYHVVAPDLRGHGDSQWSTGSTYAPAEFVYDIAQLVHQQQLAPLRIVAHSLGGNVALRYAGSYPEHVERLVVIEGWGGVLPARQRPPVPERMRGWIGRGRSTPRRRRSHTSIACNARCWCCKAPPT